MLKKHTIPTEKHLEELSKDRFNYNKLSKKILDNILLKMDLPNCFGIYGNWGSGKSTMLHFIKKHLDGGQEKYKQIQFIHFEPWKYEYSDQKNLLFALLNKIKNELKIDNTLWKKIAIHSLSITSGLLRNSKLFDPQNYEKDKNLIENTIYKEHENWTDTTEAFRNDFETIISNWSKKNNDKKLFIAIDDLDRCLPDNAVKLLESMKNFLLVNNTLFILALDRRSISSMIEKKYGLYYGYGNEYLMKIIQYYYDLPKVKVENIIDEILNIHKLPISERQKSYISNFLKTFSNEPRKTKHFLHQFCMRISISPKAKEEIKTDNDDSNVQYLFLASYVLTKFPKYFNEGNVQQLLNFFRTLAHSRNSSNPDEYKKVTDKEKRITDEDKKEIEDIFNTVIKRQNTSEKTVEPDKLFRAIRILKEFE